VLGSFTPVLPSRSTQRLFPNIHRFQVPLANLYLVCFFHHPCSTDSPSWLTYEITLQSPNIISHITFWTSEPIFMKLSMCIMSLPDISMLHVTNLSHQ
jgi:hypothetical protein